MMSVRAEKVEIWKSGFESLVLPGFTQKNYLWIVRSVRLRTIRAHACESGRTWS